MPLGVGYGNRTLADIDGIEISRLDEFLIAGKDAPHSQTVIQHDVQQFNRNVWHLHMELDDKCPTCQIACVWEYSYLDQRTTVDVMCKNPKCPTNSEERERAYSEHDRRSSGGSLWSIAQDGLCIPG